MSNYHPDEYLQMARDRLSDADEIVTAAYLANLPKGPPAGDNVMATLLYRSAEMNLKLYEMTKGSESE